jgi:tyrosinase
LISAFFVHNITFSMFAYRIRFGVALSLLSTFTSMVSAQAAIKIYAVPMPPNWPVIMAPVIPENMKLESPTFSWAFPTSQEQSCTTGGRQNVSPCRGRIVDHTFAAEGDHQIQLTVTDSSLRQPIVANVIISIRNISAFPNSNRPEIRRIPMAVWTEKYVKAFYTLKSLGIYDHLAAIHRASFSGSSAINVNGTQRSLAHSSPAFLPWHRIAMRVFERCIQVAAEDDELGLPYWDWRLGFAGLESYVGGNGDPAHGYVLKSGPFRDEMWPLASVVQESRALTRQFRSGEWRQTPQQYDRLMAIRQFDSAPFASTSGAVFRCALEGWLSSADAATYGSNHNGAHVWIGGTMGLVDISMYDPMFQIHHCNVDRLYAEWQTRWQCSGQLTPLCYRPLANDPDLNERVPGAERDGNLWVLRGQMPTDLIFPWRLRIADGLVVNQGYTYLAPDQVPPASTGRKAPGTTGDTPSSTKLDLAPPKKDDPVINDQNKVFVKRNSASKASAGLLAVAGILLSLYF